MIYDHLASDALYTYQTTTVQTLIQISHIRDTLLGPGLYYAQFLPIMLLSSAQN